MPMAALSDGSKVVVSAHPGYRESTENTLYEVLRDIKRRGFPVARVWLVHGDGHLGMLLICLSQTSIRQAAQINGCWNQARSSPVSPPSL